MGFLDDTGNEDPGYRPLTPEPPKQKAPEVTTRTLIESAFRAENEIAALTSYMGERAGLTPDPTHNPMDVIKGTRFERDYSYRFVDSVSEADTRARMMRIDREEADDRLLDSAGFAGLTARIGASLLSPTIFLPAGAIVRGSRAASVIGGTAARTAALGGAATAIQEGILYGTQETRTATESTLNVATGTIVSGILGGAIASMTAGEVARVTRTVDQFRKDLAAEMNAGAVPGAGGAVPSSTSASAGAASAVTEGLTLQSAFGAEKALAALSPVTRLQNSTLDTSRAIIRDMEDAGLAYKENFDGVATSQGGTVATRVKMRKGPLIDAIEEMDSIYARYFFGKPEPGLFERNTAALRAWWSSSGGPDGRKLTAEEFRAEIGKAMRRGDQHPVPEIAQAAKLYREKVFEPLKQEAIKLALLPKDVATVGADSYLTRIYNREKIIAQRDNFRNILVNHFLKVREDEQAAYNVRRERSLGELRASLQRAEQQRDERIASGPGGEDLATFKAQADAERKVLREPVDAKLKAAEDAHNQRLAEIEALKETGIAPGTPAAQKRIARLKAKADRLQAEKAYKAQIEEIERAAKRPAERLERRLAKQEAKLRQGFIKGGKDVQKSNAQIDGIKRTIQRWEERQFDTKVAQLDEVEIRALTDDVINTILGESAIRLPGISMLQGEKGPLRQRVLNIPDSAIEEFLESDVEKVARVYTSAMSGDIELTAKYGDVDLKEMMTKLREELNAKTNAITEKGKKGERQRKALRDQYDRDVKDIVALRDRIRGTMKPGTDPDSFLYRAGKVALNLNYIARLGGTVISSLPDIARPIMRHGLLNAFRDGWLPLITNMDAVKLSRRELRNAGTALELVRDQRSLALADLMDDYGRNSKFERGVTFISDRFSSINLMGAWTGSMKLIAGMTAMQNLSRDVAAVAAGKGSRKQIGRLAEAGIDPRMAERIQKMMDTAEGASLVNGRRLPNTEAWTDQRAIQAFRAALNRDVETAIVSPGLEKPLFMDSMTGKIIGQFKTFAFVSTQRVLLSGLQQRDMAILNGAVIAMALGALSTKLSGDLRGEDRSKWTSGQWVQESLDRSGLMGIFMEVNNISEKVTGGRVGLSAFTGKPVSRYASRNTMGALLGPSFDFVQDAATMGRVGSEGWSRSDTHAIRKILPLQNVFYLRGLFDKAEEGVNDYFNVPEKQQRNR